jgi:hypothetical protein
MRRYHFLHEGHLDDAPGRDESWTEYVAYLGRGQWALKIVGTDLSGYHHHPYPVEYLGTRRMIRWTLDRDALDRETPLSKSAMSLGADEDHPDVKKPLFGRTQRLYRVAKTVDATLCVRLLDQWVAGTWPKPPPRPLILAVHGVHALGIWRGVYHATFKVDTNLGPGFLYPPDDQGRARLVLDKVPRQETIVQLKYTGLERLAPFRDAFRNLRKDMEKRRRPG